MSPSTDTVPARRTGALRAKTLRVALLLERLMGTPHRAARRPPPLDMLIATILSQNTNDRNSHRAYITLRQRFASWQSVMLAPPTRVRAAIRTAGMATQKTRHIRGALAAIRSRYGAYDLAPIRRKSDQEVLEELTSLDGVGVKTAACVLLFALGRNVFPVDTHVHRLCTRLGLAPGCRTPEKTFAAMRDLVPPGRAHSLHTNLIRFGRTVCRPARPACGRCPLYSECVFEGKSQGAPRRMKGGQREAAFMLLDNI